MKFHAVIPVAGHGSRLLPHTKSQPKEMLPVGRKPTVQWIIEELTSSGIDRVLFVTGPGKAAIENHFDINEELRNRLREKGQEDLLAALDFEWNGVTYCYTRQSQQLGLGHAILCAETVVGEQPFVVALGDSIIGLNSQSRIVARMIELYEQQQPDAVIAFETVPEAEAKYYGIAKPRVQHQGYFELADLIEKPRTIPPPSCLAVAGRYLFHPKIFSFLHETQRGVGDEIQLTDAIALLLRRGGRVLGIPLPAGEQRYDIGNFASYFQAFAEFAMEDAEHGAELRQFLRGYLDRRAEP